MGGGGKGQGFSQWVTALLSYEDSKRVVRDMNTKKKTPKTCFKEKDTCSFLGLQAREAN